MSVMDDNAVVADQPISNGHQVHDSASSFEISGKLVTDGGLIEAASRRVQESALGAEDIPGAGDKNDDSMVTASSDDTLAGETSVEVLNVGKLVDDMEPEAPVLHASDSDKDTTTLIHDSEPLPNGHHKSLFVDESEQLITPTIAPCDKPASVAELVQEDANEVSDTVISEIPKDELPITDSTESKIPFVDVATIAADASNASLADGEPPIDASTGPDTSLSAVIATSINGVGSTTDAEPSHCLDETPISDPSTEISPTVDILEEVVVLPTVDTEEIILMAPEHDEPAVAEEPIAAEASPTEMEASSVGEEPAVTETVAPVPIEAVAEAAPEGENIPVEQESALVEAESVTVETESSTAEPEIIPTTLEAAPIESTLPEVVVEETLASAPDAEPTEPTTDAAESEPVEDAPTTVEPVTEAAESEPTEEPAPAAEALATATPVEISGADAEEPAAEVDAGITAEVEDNAEPQGAIEAEDEPAAPTEPEVKAFVPEVVSALAEVATEPVVVSTEPEEAAITANAEPEAPVELVIAAHDSIAADPELVTVPDPEPVAVAEADLVAVAEPEPATVEPEAPAAVDPEPTEPEVQPTAVETVEIDVEPPSSNASFVEDPEVGFTHADEPQTPLLEEIPVLEKPASDANDVESETQVEEPAVEETVEEVTPVDVAPTGEPASVEEVAVVEEVVAVAEVVTVEESSAEEPTSVEVTVPVEETIPVEESILGDEVVPIDVAAPTDEPAPVEEIIEDITLVDAVPPTGESASVEEVAAVEEVVAIEEFPVEEPAPVEEAVLVEETLLVDETVPGENVVPVDVVTPTGEVEEIPSVEVVAVEERAPVEEITTVPVESAAPIESSPPVEEATVEAVEPTIEPAAHADELGAPVDDAPLLEETLPSVDAADAETPVLTVEVPSPEEEPFASTKELLVACEEGFTEKAAAAIEETPLAEDPSTVNETSAPHVEPPVGEDHPAVEECLALAEVEVPESVPVEEPSAPVETHEPVAAQGTLVPEDQTVAIEETLADAEEPVFVDAQIPPAMDGTPLVAEVHSDADEPDLEATLAAEEPPAPEEEPVTVVVPDETVCEAAVATSVEEDILVVEEPLKPSDVEESEPVVPEEAPAPTGGHELVAIEDIVVPDDQSVAFEQIPVTEEASVSVDDQIPPAMNEMPLIGEVPLAADEPALDDSPTTEEPSAPEEEPTTAFAVEVPPPAVEVAVALEEITSISEGTTPVFEPAPATPADPTLDAASSPEGTTVVTEESTVESDAPVVVEEPTPVASEVLVEEEVVPEETHTALEPTEEALVISEETKDGLEDSRHADVPVSLSEEHTDEPFTEESLPTAPIVEQFVPVPAEEPKISEELQVVTSQVPVNGEHSEVDKDLEPSNVHVETSSVIEETEAVEQSETTAFEEAAEQQEIATTPALNVAIDIERPKSPWTASYSVITQGPGVPVEEHVSTYEDDEDAVPAQAQTPEIIIDEVAAVVPEIAADMEVSGQSQVDVLVTVHMAEEQVTLGEPEEPLLKSPWTPSYSVTVQGNVSQTNEGLDDLEQLPPSAAQPVEAEGVEEQPVPFIEEALISSEVIGSTTVVADTHATLSETLDESVEPDVPDSAVEAEAAQDVASGLGVIAQAEPSVLIPPEPAPVEEVLEEEFEQGTFIVEDESTQLGASDPDEEHSSSPWTPSYSVTGPEPASALEDQAAAEEGEFVEHGSFIIETQSPVVVEDAQVKSDLELLTPIDDPVGERPKSPWTPSYSVTKQGPNEAVEEVEELDEMEYLPGPVASIPALAVDEEPIPPVLIIETRASVDEPAVTEVPSEHEGTITVSELSETHDDVEVNEAVITQETPQTFPILEQPQTVAKKRSLSAINELNTAEVTESNTLRIDIPTNGANRNRLESTTSSRFFPGGWFSSSPKVPEEGRTSLDVAAGEFVHKSSVENTPTTAPSTAPSTALPSAVEEDKEKKSRWCTIM